MKKKIILFLLIILVVLIFHTIKNYRIINDISEKSSQILSKKIIDKIEYKNTFPEQEDYNEIREYVVTANVTYIDNKYYGDIYDNGELISKFIYDDITNERNIEIIKETTIKPEDVIDSIKNSIQINKKKFNTLKYLTTYIKKDEGKYLIVEFPYFSRYDVEKNYYYIDTGLLESKIYSQNNTIIFSYNYNN